MVGGMVGKLNRIPLKPLKWALTIAVGAML
jgi:hypothetical protein